MKPVPIIVGAIAAAIIAFAAYNAVVILPAAERLRSQTDVDAVVYRQNLLRPDTLVFDVRRVRGSYFDVSHSLRRAAKALKGRAFKRVVLAYRGEPKFILDGAYFGAIGEVSGPIRMWELPEHVTNLDGTAFYRPAASEDALSAKATGVERLVDLHDHWHGRRTLPATATPSP